MLRTRFTTRMGIEYPIVSAPMAGAAGGALAAAVSGAGGLGMVGGGYCDPDWTLRELENAGNQRIGCGFITWALDEIPVLLSAVLARQPSAVFLSFGDIAPYVPVIHQAGAMVFAQVQTLADAQAAVAAGADVIVAQGAEAGGHGATRATMTLVPEIADWLAEKSPDTLLLGAGGIADGRGLAACLILGADGVLIGTRFWAAEEALVPKSFHAAAIRATGDDTLRSSVTDAARGLEWPAPYDIRTLRNDFTKDWADRVDVLRGDPAVQARYAKAQAEGNASFAAPIAGEAVGLIQSVRPAADIVTEIASDADRLLSRGNWAGS